MSNPSFWNAFFGTPINNNQLREINTLLDTNRAYQHDFYGKKVPIWMNTEKPFQAYVEIPELRTVVDKKAHLIANCANPLVENKKIEAFK